MSERLIPNGDMDFLKRLRLFAPAAAKDPARFAISDDDARQMMNAFVRFEKAFQKARLTGRSQVATRAKNQARAEAARLYKRLITISRNSENLDETARVIVRARPADEKRQARTCPQEPPYLRFVQALHLANAASPMHELRFGSTFGGRGLKPPGATRLELFVDLVPPGEKVPAYPGANFYGRPWYFRSYSRSPIKLAPPICRVPMLVVYWGRWADAIGNVGPFCATVVSRIEGWTGQAQGLLGGLGQRKSMPILEDPSANSAPGPRERDEKYFIAVLDAQYQYFNPQNVAVARPALAEQRQTPQIEGPAESEAA